LAEAERFSCFFSALGLTVFPLDCEYRHANAVSLGVEETYMNKILIGLFAGLLLTLTSIGAHAQEVGASIQLHQDQIASDLKTGMMRPTEAQTVLEHLDRIKFEYKRAKSHGVMNNYERQLLTKMLQDNAQMIRNYELNKKK
jgi:hypothetical protein